MNAKKERIIQIVVAVLFVMGALALWGALANAAPAQSKTTTKTDTRTDTETKISGNRIEIVNDDGSHHSYGVKVENGKYTILEDGEPLSEDRIVKHGNTRIVLDDEGRVVYQCIVDDEGNVTYSSNVAGDRPHAFAVSGLKRGLYLGVTIGEVDEALAAQLGLKEGQGLLVRSIIEDSPAEKAGLKSYDIITRIDNQEVNDISDLRKKLREIKEGDTITLSVLRQGKSTTIKAKPEKNEGNGFFPLDGKDFNFNFNKNFNKGIHYDFDPPPHTFRFYSQGGDDGDTSVGIIAPEYEKAMEDYQKQLENKQVELQKVQERLEKIEEKLQKLLEEKNAN